MEYDVFISFSKKDKKLAQKFYDTIKKVGKNAFFFPEEQNPGDNYEQRINDALRDSCAMLLICTVHSAASRQVRKECDDYNTLFKQNLGTDSERRIFIFEGADFEDSYVPDIEDWDKIHRCNNFNKQVKAIVGSGNRKKTKKNIIAISSIIALLLAGVGIFYSTKPEPNQRENCEGKSIVLTADSIVEQQSGKRIKFNDYIKSISGFKDSTVIWQDKEKNIVNSALCSDTANSGKYIITVSDNECVKQDSLILNILPKPIEILPKPIEVDNEKIKNEKEYQSLIEKVNKYMSENKYKEAENKINEAKKYGDVSKIKSEYDTRLQQFIEKQFITKPESDFGEYIITRNKRALWGIRDKYGIVQINCIYQNSTFPQVSNGKVLFKTAMEEIVCYNEKLEPVECN
jgi:hypothetical protein